MILRILALSASLILAACQSGPDPRPSFSQRSAASLAYADALTTSDPRFAAIVIDAESGVVLHSENADALRYPASLTKMMTLYILFEELENGRLRAGTPLVVSAEAARQPPAKLGLKPGSKITAEDAILALAVKSANDVATVVAENISGSEAAFANRMTRTARALGMGSTIFRNASGLPDAAQVTTARDMATLARALQTRFPGRYRVFSTRSFTYAGRAHRSTNELLGAVPGMDGIKTGYIRASGYNLATSVQRGGRRIIVVVMGGKSRSARDMEVRALIGEYMPSRSGLLSLF